MSIKKRISLEQVNSRNTNLFRYSPELVAVLRKERYKPAQPAAYNNHCDVTGILGYTEPLHGYDEQIDFDAFEATLEGIYKSVFRCIKMGMNQTETARYTGVSQSTVCLKMKVIRDCLRDFYSRG